MKVNIQKTKNRFISILGAVSVFVLVCSFVFSFIVPVTVYAEWGKPLNYQELDYTVRLGSDYNTVTVPLPADNYYFSWKDDSGVTDSQYGGSSFVIPGTIGDSYRIRVYPASSFGLALDNIPDGSTLQFDIELTEYVSDETGYVDYQLPEVELIGHYLVIEDGSYVWKDTEVVGTIAESPIGGRYTCEFVINSPVSNALSFVPLIQFNDFVPLTESLFKIEILSAVLDMEISADYWQQWQNEQNGEMLNSIDDKLDTAISGTPEQNAQAGEAVDKMEDLGSEIDDFGDSLQTTTPDMSTIEFKLDKLVDHPTLLAYVAPIQQLWKNKTLTSMLVIVATLVIVSWVFFGKKSK